MSAPTVSITASQTSKGAKTVECDYTLSSVESGASLEFYVKPPSTGFQHMSDYDGSASNGDFSETLDLEDIWDGFGDYKIRLWVYNSNAEEDKDYDDITVSMQDNRPNSFSFSSAIQSGAATTTLTASAWNNFQDRINDFESYQGVSETNFDEVDPGDKMTASILGAAWTAINNLSGHGTMPTRPSQGSIIYASWFHDLADALNEIE